MPVKQTNVPGFMFTITFEDSAVNWKAAAPMQAPEPVPPPQQEPMIEKK